MSHVARRVLCSYFIISWHSVDGGERAIVFDRFRGVLPEAVGEGTHFRVPWVQTPNIMDIRTRPRTINSVTGTKGGEIYA
jgi:prohibitin 1